MAGSPFEGHTFKSKVSSYDVSGHLGLYDEGQFKRKAKKGSNEILIKKLNPFA